MKRALFFSHNLNFEGAPLFLFNLVRTLKKKPSDVAVAAPGMGPLYNKYHDADILVSLPKKRIRQQLEGREFTEFVKKTAQAMQPDSIFVNSLVLYKAVEILLKEYGIKAHVNWIIHESEKDLYSSEYNGIDLSLLSRTHRTIFVSEATKNIYCEFDKGNYEVIYNGIDIESIELFQKQAKKNNLCNKLGLDKGKKNIVFPGTTCLRKGQIDMIRALAYYRSYLATEKYHVYMVGGRWSEYLNDMNYLVNLFQLERLVTIVPETNTDTMYGYYLASDLFVNFSYIESLPLTVLEAMAFELPIIASNVYGIPELVTANKEAVLINPGNEIQLIYALNDLLTNDKKAKILAENAKKKVIEQFSLQSMVKKYLQVM